MRILVRAFGVMVLIAMVVFPPWKMTFTSGPENQPGTDSIGLHPLWYRLELQENDPRASVEQKIDLVRLGIELGIALLVINGALWFVRKQSRDAG